ncbi:MAG: hypothetical protein WD533_07655 [Dehalococcoidia bacterium]
MSTVRQELQSSWAPKDMVLAVLPDPAKSESVHDELLDAGFAEGSVTVLRAGEAVEALDIEGKRTDHSFLRPFHAIWGYLSVEAPELRVYEEASEAGQDIIAVKALTAREVARANDVLTRFEATEVRHFADWNISDVPSDNDKS